MEFGFWTNHKCKLTMNHQDHSWGCEECANDSRISQLSIFARPSSLYGQLETRLKEGTYSTLTADKLKEMFGDLIYGRKGAETKTKYIRLLDTGETFKLEPGEMPVKINMRY